ncbi:hypothetical protein P4S64_16680 [Vibrio sp. M60_M31a]
MWLDEQLERLRANTQLEDYLEALEPIASTLVSAVIGLLPCFITPKRYVFRGYSKT